jgi:hypothetical protein
MLDLSGASATENGATLSSAIMAGAGQFWLTPQFWLKGGLGIGQLSVSDSSFSDQSDTKLAITGAGGYEVYQSGNFAVDIKARLSIISFSNGNLTSFAAMAGVNWY